jgi:hypothetical protein
MQIIDPDSRSAARPLDVLLVSDDPRWTTSVREAVAAEGGVVETVSARAAVARLASAGTHLSHILVDRNGAEGLLDTLADLTSDTASAEVTLLVLGSSSNAAPWPRVIPMADRQSVAESLAVRQLPACHNEPTLAPPELLEVVNGEMIETRYQPIVRIADRAVTAVEVLARLNHPTHGTVTPDWFVPRFEDAARPGAD